MARFFVALRFAGLRFAVFFFFAGIVLFVNLFFFLCDRLRHTIYFCFIFIIADFFKCKKYFFMSTVDNFYSLFYYYAGSHDDFFVGGG